MCAHPIPKPPYQDRAEAGRFLAERIVQEVALDRPAVLALPRGGVPVAFEVSERLDAPLDIVVVRKLGVPGHEELAMGAIAAGARVVNEEVITALGLDDADIEEVAAREQRELARRELEYRQGRPPMPVAGRQVILIDDGLATGATMRAAALAVRARDPIELIVAVPVGAAEACADLEPAVDRVLCAALPQPFYGVGRWYRNFGQTTDQEVQTLLAAARRREDGSAERRAAS